MLRWRFLPLLAFIAPTLSWAALDEATAARQAKAHVTFLADDLLEGRAAGSRGYDLAAHYVAAQFQTLGLQPGAGANGYKQPVRMVDSVREPEAARFTLRPSAGAAAESALEPLADFVISPALGSETAEVSGAAVFVGFGVHAPEQGYSDYPADIDLKGKIAVVLFGAPAKFPATARAHYADRDTKAAELARRGAVALLTVRSPADESRTPWASVLASVRFPSAALVGADHALIDVVREIRISGTMSPTGAGKLFASAPQPLAEIFTAAAKSEPPRFPLGVELTLSARAKLRPFLSSNVLAILPGSDPALANDYVVITSHLDHLGIGTPLKGDAIYNGAIDNAVGVAALISAAQQLVASGVRPRRPILFAAVTAEEKGLLGARHLSRNPPAGGRFAANLNVDAGPFFAPLRAVIGMGREHTTMGPLFERVVTARGWMIRPDPRPEENRFVRSDQYSFVREGVPALRVLAAPESTDPSINLAEIDRVFWRDRYHKPDDDLQHLIHFESLGAFSVLLAEVTQAVADSETAPAWLPGDFFGQRFGRQK